MYTSSILVLASKRYDDGHRPIVHLLCCSKCYQRDGIKPRQVQFWLKKTPIEPHHTPKTLTVEGPYRLSRNPIYLALVMLMIASALGNKSMIGLLCTPALWVILDRRFATREEALLVETFGEEAETYLHRTRRWL